MSTYWRMTYPDIISELEDYCGATGLKPSTVCVRALENSRFYEREKRRAEMLAEKARLIRAYMTANPVESGGPGQQ